MRVSRAAAMAAALAVVGCGGNSDDDDGTGPITLPTTAQVAAGSSSNTFTPRAVAIAPGGTVTWTFGALQHNVIFGAANGAPENIPGAVRDTTVTRSFPTAGTFNYLCTLHENMNGTITVGQRASGQQQTGPGYGTP